MKNLLNPTWIVLVNILPIVLLLTLFYGQLNIIKSLLSNEALLLWNKFFIWLTILTSLQIIYVIFCIVKRMNISAYHSIFNLIIYTATLYFSGQSSDLLIPFSIPRWMVNIEPFFYAGTFLMPSLMHSLFTLVIMASRKSNSSSAWLSFLYGISIPILGYLFLQIVLPLWQNTGSDFGTHTLIILGIVASILFLFFICKGFYIISTKRFTKPLKHLIYLKILLCIIFPILGLLINNGVFESKHSYSQQVFGDFSSKWFYIITVLNGILLCLNKFQNKNFKLFRFILLLSFFPNTLYFFFIFLPFLPFAIVAVIVVGIGFLMLTPLILFILQTNDLYEQYNELKKTNSKLKLMILGSIAFLVLPFLITAIYLRDKYTLQNALEYVYSPDYSKKYNINSKSLLNTVQEIKDNKHGRVGLSSQKLPFLTSYYNWLVLDNMVLSEQKIAKLKQIFEGKNEENKTSVTSFPTHVKISKVKTKSVFDSQNQVWKSIIDLELTNPKNDNLESYETIFDLPDGCWITNYYLNIGNRKEYGILAEKKSALWIFSQIRNENRDPGILYYLTGNRVAFKIFPFNKKETRKSGIELTHKEPITFKIDEKTIVLGTEIKDKKEKIITINGTTYIPRKKKAKLNIIKRIPKYHFLIDVSVGKENNKQNYFNRVTQFIKQKKIKNNQISIQFTNSFTEEVAYKSNWSDKFIEQEFDGGFYVEGAIKKILTDNYNNSSNFFPVIVTVSDGIGNEILEEDFKNFKAAFPESNLFYELDEDNNLWSHSLELNPKNRIEKVTGITNNSVRILTVNAKKKFYLPDDNEASITVDNSLIESDFLMDKKDKWKAGLNLQGLWLAQILNNSDRKNNHLEIIKESMITGILSPVTSYLVVENEAQKKTLKKKQDQILSGNKNLDPDEDTRSMDEPSIYLLLLLILIAYKFKNRLNHKLFK